MKAFLIALLCAFLVACGGSDDEDQCVGSECPVPDTHAPKTPARESAS